MKQVILLKLGELTLKGLNRHQFIKRLFYNIKKTTGIRWIDQDQNRYYIPIEKADKNQDSNLNFLKTNTQFNHLTRIFGLKGICPSIQIEKNHEKLKSIILLLVKNEIMNNIHTFKIETRRIDKSYPLNSYQINCALGDIICDNFPELKVNVHKPDLLFHIEIRDNIYIYKEIIPTRGGLPVGTGGYALALLSGGIDSPVAAYLMAKRGVSVSLVHFYSFPYTSLQAKEKVITLAKHLTKFLGRTTLYLVKISNIQEIIRDNCKNTYFTILTRKIMYLLAEKIACEYKYKALICGESLGQVASQTMESISSTSANISLPIFRPLIGMDKAEITVIAENIDSYKISIQDLADCCTLFAPKHPETRPKKEIMEDELVKIPDLGVLLNDMLNNMEILKIE